MSKDKPIRVRINVRFKSNYIQEVEVNCLSIFDFEMYVKKVNKRMNRQKFVSLGCGNKGITIRSDEVEEVEYEVIGEVECVNR